MVFIRIVDICLTRRSDILLPRGQHGRPSGPIVRATRCLLDFTLCEAQSSKTGINPSLSYPPLPHTQPPPFTQTHTQLCGVKRQPWNGRKDGGLNARVAPKITGLEYLIALM